MADLTIALDLTLQTEPSGKVLSVKVDEVHGATVSYNADGSIKSIDIEFKPGVRAEWSDG